MYFDKTCSFSSLRVITSDCEIVQGWYCLIKLAVDFRAFVGAIFCTCALNFALPELIDKNIYPAVLAVRICQGLAEVRQLPNCCNSYPKRMMMVLCCSYWRLQAIIIHSVTLLFLQGFLWPAVFILVNNWSPKPEIMRISGVVTGGRWNLMSSPPEKPNLL